MDIQSNGMRFRRVVEKIESLPALPSIAARLIEVVNSPDSSAEDAAELIQNDPALTSKIIRLANSAFYGMPRSISSVSSAVVILGFNTLRSVALSAAIMNIFKSCDGTFDYKRFWRHSVVCGMNAKSIAGKNIRLIMVDPEGAFCMGILHDIGKLIFAQFFSDEYGLVGKKVGAQQLSTLQAEQEVFGLTHTRIGATLADKWALPVEVESVLIHHHSPDQSPAAREFVALVSVADDLCHRIGLGVGEKERLEPVKKETMELLGIKQDDYPQLIEMAKRNLAHSDEFLSIIGDNG